MKTKIKKLLIPAQTILLLLIINAVFGALFVKASVGYLKPVFAVASVNTKIAEKAPESQNIKKYAYNDLVPVEVVKAEITKQAEMFGNDVQFMLNLAFMESGYNNLAENPKSSAEGVYQFLYGTWRATKSGKKHISRFDYKANIREANIKIANLEYSHWADCLN